MKTKMILLFCLLCDYKERKMNDEIRTITKNDTWELATLAQRHKANRVTWVYKAKKNKKRDVEKCKTRLLAKEYNKNMTRYLL